jgi:hypothetical protein
MGNEEGGERRGSAAERSFHLTMRCSGWCEVWGVGCGVWGVGCEVWGVGCGVWGVGCGVWGVGCGAP